MIQLELYTFILEYRGGTYISQFEATTPEKALERWIEEHDNSVIWKLKDKHTKQIREWCEESGPVEIRDNTNVWCFIFYIKDHRGLLNFVKTKGEL